MLGLKEVNLYAVNSTFNETIAIYSDLHDAIKARDLENDYQIIVYKSNDYGRTYMLDGTYYDIYFSFTFNFQTRAFVWNRHTTSNLKAVDINIPKLFEFYNTITVNILCPKEYSTGKFKDTPTEDYLPHLERFAIIILDTWLHTRKAIGNVGHLYHLFKSFIQDSDHRFIRDGYGRIHKVCG